MANLKETNYNDTSTVLEASCLHCGESCDDHVVYLEDKTFCCDGCKTVYEILHDNDMCNYYELDQQAGFSLKGKKQLQFAYLDDEQVIEQLLDFQSQTMASVHFLLPQIHCSSCIWLLENLYQFNEGITKSRVSFLKKEIHIQYDPQVISLRQVVELLDSIAYTPAISFNDLEKKEIPLIERSFFYKLGIAGFAFGNIMLLSFPEYLGLEKNVDPFFFQLFGYLNIVLSLPLVFYSAQDYLKSAWIGLRKRHLNIDVPISLGILTLFGRSLFEILSQSGAGYLDSLAGLIFFLLIGKWFQKKTYHKLSFERDYKSYFPIAANKLENGKETNITLDKLEKGDIIRVRHHEIIPADGILLSGEAAIDYSFVTGESNLIEVENQDKIFAGGRQMKQAIDIQLTKKVAQSYLTQLWNDDTFQKENNSDTSELADRVGKYFTVSILVIAFSTLLYWLPIDMSIAINAFTAVLIIACPCAVALAIPFIFGNAIRILGKKEFYLKNTAVIEKLANFTAVVVDKTGTLTSRKKGQIQFVGNTLSLQQWSTILSITNHSNHPISKKISDYIQEKHPEINEKEVADWQEHLGQGIEGWVEEQFVQIGSANFVNTDAQNGVFIKVNAEIWGYFLLDNPFRKGFEQLIRFFKKSAELHLLSGDNDHQKEALVPYFNSDQQLHFYQSPKDKLTFVKQLQEKEHKVLMLGDGLNDAGALKQSNVGVVITENTNNFTPASDAILHAKHFDQLTTYFEFARKSIRLVYLAYGFALIYNFIGLSFAVQGLLSPIIAAILMPASSISIVLFGILASNMVARRMQLL
jgi:Cu+-exporting ATPase